MCTCIIRFYTINVKMLSLFYPNLSCRVIVGWFTSSHLYITLHSKTVIFILHSDLRVKMHGYLNWQIRLTDNYFHVMADDQWISDVTLLCKRSDLIIIQSVWNDMKKQNKLRQTKSRRTVATSPRCFKKPTCKATVLLKVLGTCVKKL